MIKSILCESSLAIKFNKIHRLGRNIQTHSFSIAIFCAGLPGFVVERISTFHCHISFPEIAIFHCHICIYIYIYYISLQYKFETIKAVKGTENLSYSPVEFYCAMAMADAGHEASRRVDRVECLWSKSVEIGICNALKLRFYEHFNREHVGQSWPIKIYENSLLNKLFYK